MSSGAELEVVYRIGNAGMRTFPYPHIYVRDIFPPDYYEQIRRNLPPSNLLRPIAEARPVKGYPERFVLNLVPDEIDALPQPYREFWKGFSAWLFGGRFAAQVCSKFKPYIDERFRGMENVKFADEALLVEDRTNYSLGPHTDSPQKVLALIFYLPGDESQSHLGTSIYVPKDPQFTCPGNAHHPFDRFERMVGMPFVPNSMFCFLKTRNSFHGVEPVRDANTRRHLLLYDIRLALEPQPAASSSKFTF